MNITKQDFFKKFGRLNSPKKKSAVHGNIKSRAFFLAITALFILGHTGDFARADDAPSDTPIAADACDDAFYTSLENKAWLEAQRELVQNQNLIAKPDSVLQYTCFNKFLSHLAYRTDKLFSRDKTRMRDALKGLVGNTVITYVNSNFRLDGVDGGPVGALGGRPAGSSVPMTMDDLTADPTTYDCDRMQQVWQAAKCTNFIEKNDTDGFFTFQEYSATAAAGNDKRQYPAPMACHVVANEWSAHIIAAGLDPDTPVPWADDPMQTFKDQMDPGNCGKTEYPPIPTGLKVARPEGTPYEEHICVQPGCYYKPDGTGGGDCTSKP